MSNEELNVKLALKNLVDRLEEIHNDSRYTAVWSNYYIHGGKYTGPTYVKELEEAKEALRTPSPLPNKLVELCEKELTNYMQSVYSSLHPMNNLWGSMARSICSKFGTSAKVMSVQEIDKIIEPYLQGNSCWIAHEQIAKELHTSLYKGQTE